MVPLSEYATVSKDATLYEAVSALEKAQASFDPKRFKHRAILVFDNNKKIVGKISQMDIIRALEPGYKEALKDESFTKLGLSPIYQKQLIEQYMLWNKPLTDICKKAAQLKVESFMYTPTEGEYVRVDATLDEAIHQLICGCHQSLLVTKDGDIVGILRLTDVFCKITSSIKQCNI